VDFCPFGALIGKCLTAQAGIARWTVLKLLALKFSPLLDCEAADSNHDGEVTIDEILTAVNNALNGCVQTP
jgi:hypothetical protein